MRRFAAALFAASVVSFPSAQERATAATGNIQLCNNFPHPVLFATAWKINKMAYSRGWYTVGSNHCTSVELPVKTFFWYAKSTKYLEANGDTVITIWQDKSHPYCTATSGFYFNHADGPCGKNARSGFETSFTRTDGIPLYETVQITQSGGSSQTIVPGHTQELTAP